MMENTEKKVREPLFHIAKRATIPWWKAWLIRILTIVIALAVCGAVTLVFTGLNPIKVYVKMFEGSFSTQRRIWSFLQNSATLLCMAIAVTPAFKMKFWNLGAEGQVLIGGLATTYCMLTFGGKLSTPLMVIVMLFASIAAGMIWALIPALFKAHWNSNETLFTLMMNYIAIQLVSYFSTVWANPKGSGHIGVIPNGWLPTYYNNYLVNILVVVAITIFMYIYLKSSKHGYEISVVGESENTARYIGINVKSVIVRTMLLSGAICGIAGLILVGGTDHTLSRDTAGGRGFTAVMVSWLAKFNPIFMILTSMLIIFLGKGASNISVEFGLNESFSDIITGIIIFFIIGCEFFINYTIKLCKTGKEEAAK